jgi:hypothetical protein
MMQSIKTDAAVLERLRRNAVERLPKAEAERQRASLVYGLIGWDSTLTLEQVRDMIEGPGETKRKP